MANILEGESVTAKMGILFAFMIKTLFPSSIVIISFPY
jgi:hypothetical protein